MVRLIHGQCVQSLMQRNKQESSCGNKDLNWEMVPRLEHKNGTGRQESGAEERQRGRYDPDSEISVRKGLSEDKACLRRLLYDRLFYDRLGALVANCSSCGLPGRALWILA